MVVPIQVRDLFEAYAEFAAAGRRHDDVAGASFEDFSTRLVFVGPMVSAEIDRHIARGSLVADLTQSHGHGDRDELFF